MSSSSEVGQVHELPTELVVARYAQLARRILVRRQSRRKLLPQGMLVDVAWDLLLELLAGRGEPGANTTAALAAAAGLSPTVADRWLGLLQADGLVCYRGHGWELSAGFLARMIAHFREHYPDAI